MNLPDVNEMYPQEEPLNYSTCIRCSDEIAVGDEYAETHDYDFCSMECWEAQSIEDGLVTIKIAGDDITRIV